MAKKTPRLRAQWGLWNAPFWARQRMLAQLERRNRSADEVFAGDYAPDSPSSAAIAPNSLDADARQAHPGGRRGGLATTNNRPCDVCSPRWGMKIPSPYYGRRTCCE